MLKFEADRLTYSPSGYGIMWEIPLKELAVIGEWGEDCWMESFHYLCLIDLRKNEYCLEVNQNTLSVLELLSARLGCPLEPKLSLAVEYESRVLFPSELAGKPLYDTQETASGLWKWILLISLRYSVNRVLSKPVLQFLNTYSPTYKSLPKLTNFPSDRD